MMIQNLSEFLFALELKDKLATVGIRCDWVSEKYLEIQSNFSIEKVDKKLNDIIPDFAWSLKKAGRRTKGTVRIITTEAD